MLECLLTLIEDNFFDGAKWLKGVGNIGYKNYKSLIFLNAKIEVVLYDQVPFHRKLEMWVSTPILVNNAMIDLIERQNKDWTIKRRCVRNKCKRNAIKDQNKTLLIRTAPSNRSIETIFESETIIPIMSWYFLTSL